MNGLHSLPGKSRPARTVGLINFLAEELFDRTNFRPKNLSAEKTFGRIILRPKEVSIYTNGRLLLNVFHARDDDDLGGNS